MPWAEAGVMDDAVLRARDLHCGYEGREVITGVDVALLRGEFLGLIGPNGSGKTTLLRALAGRLVATSGKVLLDGVPMHAMPRRTVAQQLAVVPQISSPPFEFSVGEVVAMGRTPHLGRLQAERPADRAAIERAMALTHTERLRDRPVTELSGGEFQRVVIARALAQEAPVMLLDEPAAHLDIGHQVDIFDLLLRLNREEGRSILCVSHDLNLAARYCDRLVAMSGGAVAAQGAPARVLTEERVSDLYRCSVRVVTGPDGRPHVTPVSAVSGRDAQ